METNCLVDKSDTKQIQTKENIDNYNNMKKEKCDSVCKNKHIMINKQANEKNNELMRADMLNKVTTEDLQKLCEQLRAFNERIQMARQLTNVRYDLPGTLRELLEREAGELECLYAELQDAAKNIETTRLQRTALAAERLSMEDQLTRLKAEGVAELEVIVSVYDGAMMERWQAVKTGSSVAAVENFLHDVKGKLEAMKNLQILGSQKLAELQDEGKKDTNVNKLDKKKKKEQGGRGGGRERGRGRGSYNMQTSQSQTSLPFLLDSTDSEDLLDDGAVHSVLYSLVCDQVFSLPAWTTADTSLDID